MPFTQLLCHPRRRMLEVRLIWELCACSVGSADRFVLISFASRLSSSDHLIECSPVSTTSQFPYDSFSLSCDVISLSSDPASETVTHDGADEHPLRLQYPSCSATPDHPSRWFTSDFLALLLLFSSSFVVASGSSHLIVLQLLRNRRLPTLSNGPGLMTMVCFNSMF